MMFAERTAALLRTVSPRDLFVCLIEAQKASHAATNPTRAAYAIVDRLTERDVAGALEAHAKRKPARSEPSAVAKAKRLREEYLISLISQAMGRPGMPSWSGEHDPTVWAGALEAAQRWDEAHCELVSRRLDEVVEAGRERVAGGMPVHEVRRWVEQQARETSRPGEAQL